MRQETNSLNDSQLITVDHVAELLAIHPRSVWRLVSARQLPEPIRLTSRITRWRHADIQRFLAEKIGGER